MPGFNANTSFMSKKFGIDALLDNLIKETERLEHVKAYGEGTPQKTTMNQRISGLKEIKASWDHLSLTNVVQLIRIATDPQEADEIGAKIDILKKPGLDVQAKVAVKANAKALPVAVVVPEIPPVSTSTSTTTSRGIL